MKPKDMKRGDLKRIRDTFDNLYTLRGNITGCHNEDVFKFYEEIGVLGEGSMGSVSCIRKRQSGFCLGLCRAGRQQHFALKTIQLRRICLRSIDELKNEIDILRRLDHPNIVRAYDTFEDAKQLCIVMELCSGGDLSTRLPYTEDEALHITKSLLSAVAFMHERGVVHRDLKLENIMFETKSPNAEIKVIDFGLSKSFTEDRSVMTKWVGTLYTMAPQVIQGVYTSQADLWSVGVITYVLLSNSKPFYHTKRKYVIDKIMRCSYNFSNISWKKISSEAQHFITSLIELDPAVRLTAPKALKHRWLLSMKRQLSKKTRRVESDIHDGLLKCAENSCLKKTALMFVAHKSTTAEIRDLRDIFFKYDEDRDGCVSYGEFGKAMKEFQYSDEEIKYMFREVDLDGDGFIYFTEFIAATLETRVKIEEDRLAEAFERMDKDSSGFINRNDLRHILGSEYTPGRVDQIMDQVDVNNDGQISYEEFLSHFNEIVDSESGFIEVEAPETEDDDDLLDENALIPGGKMKSAVKKFQNAASVIATFSESTAQDPSTASPFGLPKVAAKPNAGSKAFGGTAAHGHIISSNV